MSITLQSLTQNEIEQVIFTIEGYRLPRSFETREAAFERAKEEALKNLREYVAKVETMTSEKFYYLKKR